MKPAPGQPLVLGIHPTSRGIGWAAFTDPFTVHKHGVYRTPKRDKSAACLKKAGWLMDRLAPEVLVLEAFGAESSVRSKRIRMLCLDIVNLAADRGIELAVYRRVDIQEAFRVIEARSRDEIAEAVTRHVTALAPYLPDRRKAWLGEDRRLSLLSAAAVVLTHYHFEASRLFDDLKRAA